MESNSPLRAASHLTSDLAIFAKTGALIRPPICLTSAIHSPVKGSANRDQLKTGEGARRFGFLL